MTKQQQSMLVLAVVTTFMATALFLPGPIRAGDLEPPAAPDSTMKTLDEIPPTWSQILLGSERFELVLNDQAVLDKETGLVWEQAPDTSSRTWLSGCTYCYQKEVANRKGWRLPTVEELASLVDNDNSNPSLPTNHPFTNVQSTGYWSSSTYADYTLNAWYVDFANGNVGHTSKTQDGWRAWCVRGGHGHDAY
jgi:hypothetical protein